MQSLDDRASGASKNEGAGERRFARRNRMIVALALVLLATLGVLYFRTVQSFERATLRLVDDTGQPAVGLDVFAEHVSLFRSQVVSLGRSDEAGRVDLTKLKQAGVFGRVQFVVEMIGFDAPKTVWQEHMTIVVPRHGEVALQLVDDDDAPWRRAHAVDTRVWMHWAEGWGHRSLHFDERGTVELGVVACGCNVTLNVGLHLVTTTVELVAPGPGERVEQRVPVPVGTTRLCGVLVREDGLPVGDQVCPVGEEVWLRGNIEHERGRQSFSAFHLRPEPSGHFEFLLESRPLRGTVTIRDQTGREVTVELGQVEPGEQVLDLGVLRMAR